MHKLIILFSILFLQYSANAGISLGTSYGDYNFSPFISGDSSDDSSGTPYRGLNSSGGEPEREMQFPPDMLLYSPADNPSVIAYRNRVMEEERRLTDQVREQVKDIEADIERMINSSYGKVLIVKKYREIYVKRGFLTRKDIDYLVSKNFIIGVIRPYELSIENKNDGLNPYRDQIYGKDSTLNERKITRIKNFHNHAFRDARWDNLKRMKRGDDLAVFESVEHFQAVELLSRMNIYYSNKFLNKENPSKEDIKIGHSLLDDAKSVGDFARGIGHGAKNTIVETVKGIPVLVKKTYSAITNYEQTIDQVNRLIEQFDGDKFASAVEDFFEHKWDKFVEGNAYQKGEMVGALTTEISSMLIPGTGAIKLTAKAAKYSKLVATVAGRTKVGRGLISIAKKVGNVSGEVLSSYIKTSRRILHTDIGAVGYLDDFAQHTPLEQFINTGGFLKDSAKLSKNADEYILRQSVGVESIFGKGHILTKKDLTRISQKYTQIEASFEKGISMTEFEGEVYRAVAERYMGIDQIIPANGLSGAEEIKKVFEWHKGVKVANGRYGLGGRQGQEVLYTAVGPEKKAFETIMEEFKDSVNEQTGRLIVDEPLRLASKEIKVKRVLDLTSPDIINQLGIELEAIAIKYKDRPFRAYEVTQQIGHLAQKYGFEAIMAPSAENFSGGGVNLIILSKEVLLP